MIAVERLTIKLQELFGGNYFMLPFYKLNTEYTTAKQVVENGNVGYVNYYNDAYSNLRKRKIIGIVNLQNPQRTNTDFYYVTSSFTIDFSVPTNIRKVDENGNLLEEVPFNFFEDYERVASEIINKTIKFDDTYKGKMVISEPVYQLTEKDGELNYAIYRITGTFSISDKATFGSDYKVELLSSDGKYYELQGINSFVEILNNGANAIVKQDTTKTQQNVAQSSWVCTVSIDDADINPFVSQANNMIYNLIHKNEEFMNIYDDGVIKLSRKLKVKISKISNLINDWVVRHEFWAIVSITFRTTRNGVGTYEISFTDDNKGV